MSVLGPPGRERLRRYYLPSVSVSLLGVEHSPSWADGAIPRLGAIAFCALLLFALTVWGKP